MGAFSGLKDAKRGYSSNPLQPGKYVVRIDACDFFEAETKGEMWKNTLTILAVEEGNHRVGEIVHTFFRVHPGASGKQMFQSNLKTFVAGVLGCEDEEVGEDNTKEILSEANPLRGLVTVVSASQRTSKTKKYDEGERAGEAVEYVVYSWSACLNDAEILAAIGDDAFAEFFPAG